MSIYLTILFTLVVSLNEIMAAKFKLTNTVCKSYNQSWVTIEHCRLHAIRRDETLITISINIYYPATSISTRYKVLKKANGYKPWLFDGIIDACAFIEKRNNPVANMVYKLTKSSTTINHSCPYTGHQELKDFFIKPDQIPLPLPTGDYAIMLTWIFSGKPQFSTNIYFTYEEDLIKQSLI